MSAKINPIGIISAHLSTLRNDINGTISVVDWILFFILPIIAFGCFGISHQRLTNEVFNGSASVFGIFVGLLLNVQVAIFSIFLRKPERSADPATQAVNESTVQRRADVLRQLNANIAYLILASSFAIALCMAFLSTKYNSPWFTGALAALYIHILLNLAMTVKRAFLLFDAEYQNF